MKHQSVAYGFESRNKHRRCSGLKEKVAAIARCCKCTVFQKTAKYPYCIEIYTPVLQVEWCCATCIWCYTRVTTFPLQSRAASRTSAIPKWGRLHPVIHFRPDTSCSSPIRCRACRSPATCHPQSKLQEMAKKKRNNSEMSCAKTATSAVRPEWVGFSLRGRGGRRRKGTSRWARGLGRAGVERSSQAGAVVVAVVSIVDSARLSLP